MDQTPYQKLEAQYREVVLRREEEDREFLDAAASEKAKLEELNRRKRGELEEKSQIQASSLMADEWAKMKEFRLQQHNERQALDQRLSKEFEEYQARKAERLAANQVQCDELKKRLDTELKMMDDNLKEDIFNRRRTQQLQRESEDAATKENMFKLLQEQTGFVEKEDSPVRPPRGPLKARRTRASPPPGAGSTVSQATRAPSGSKIIRSNTTDSQQRKDNSIKRTPGVKSKPDSQPETSRLKKKLKLSEYIGMKNRALAQKHTSNTETSTPAEESTFDDIGDNYNTDNSPIDPHHSIASEAGLATSDAETIVLRLGRPKAQMSFPVLRLHCPDIDPKTKKLRSLSEWRPSEYQPTMHLHLDHDTLRPYTNKYCDDEHPDWVISLGFIWCLSYNPKNAVVFLLRGALKHGPQQWQSRDVWIEFLDACVMQGFVDYCRGKLGRGNFHVKHDLEIPSFEDGDNEELGGEDKENEKL